LIVHLLGVNHRTADADLRGALSIAETRLPDLLGRLRAEAPEAAVLSTCNRTEVYAAAPPDAQPSLLGALADHAGVPERELRAYSYVLSGPDAVYHLFSVAAGLDSVVLGEGQILGQVRGAWERARRAGATGPTLNTLFRHALEAGKDVRSRTSISRGAVSIAHAAIELGRKELGGLAGRNVVVLGAGETGRLAALNLRSAGAGRVAIANRTLARAESLAVLTRAEAVPFAELPSALADADMLVACARAPEPLVSAPMLAAALDGRAERPMLLMDLGVPRNVAPGARAVPGARLYDMDDLQAVCERNRHARARAGRRAERNLQARARRFLEWQRQRDALPLLLDLRSRADRVRAEELASASGRLARLSDRERAAVEGATRAIVNRLLHEPTVWLKEHSTEEQRRWVARMWSLAGPEESPPSGPG
jgi:glutamyl-tRNA reductase